MTYTWQRDLADVLRAAGVPVIEEGDWEHRGRPGGTFTPRGIMLHHDASPAGETSNGADVIINGRPDLAGPLAQLWLDYDGTWHIIAAGRANHAGEGHWHDVPEDSGNEYLIGIESDHTTNEQWTTGQRQYGLRGLVALADHYGLRTSAGHLKDWLMAHKEYAPTRKVDPDPLDMDQLRAVVLAGDTGGILGMSSVDVFSNSTPQEFTGNGPWKTVVLDDDGALSLLVGPLPAYIVTAGVTLEPSGAHPIAVGDIVQLRYQAVIDYDDDRATVVEAGYPITEVAVTSGKTFGNLTWVNKLPDSDDGKQKLRLFVLPPDGKTLTISKVAARALS